LIEDEITIPPALYSVNGQTNGIHMGRMATLAINAFAKGDISVEENPHNLTDESILHVMIRVWN
jgi:hypothetical protein